MLNISVRTSTGKTLHVDLAPTATIGDLQQKINDITHIDPIAQRFILCAF